MNVHVRLEKKKIGSFYTPLDLAGLITSDVLCSWVSRRIGTKIEDLDDLAVLSRGKRERSLALLKSVRILDPAAGDGAFLLEAAKWLDDARSLTDDELDSTDRRADIVGRSLYGVDVVPEAVADCEETLLAWISETGSTHIGQGVNVLCGNSLVGEVRHSAYGPNKHTIPGAFHWTHEFPEVFTADGGFDVILGNPPYGNILSQAERDYISDAFPTCVGGSRKGTWNAAAHFIVRASELLAPGGAFGLLVPNSILRVTQFQKTRDFLLNAVHLWKIVDEASPFDDVTLEMVSLFAEKGRRGAEDYVQIESRRPGHERNNLVHRDVMETSRIFPIYHDSIHAEMISAGERDLLAATRGRDIPKAHVSKERNSLFKTPYLTSGRSVKRYRMDRDHLLFADDWFLEDDALRFSFENELLVSTKNYRYPRCVLKPKGIIHGGGIVWITGPSELDIRALGLILNSELVRFASIRYLTNYSELTTCLNTGIMNDLPLVVPDEQAAFSSLFNALSSLYSSGGGSSEQVRFFENLANALVYDLFFGEMELQNTVGDTATSSDLRNRGLDWLYATLRTDLIEKKMREVSRSDVVKTIRRFHH